MGSVDFTVENLQEMEIQGVNWVSTLTTQNSERMEVADWIFWADEKFQIHSLPLKTLKNLYDSPIGISKKKKDGLLSLCEKKLIKAQYHSFYQNLPVEANQEQEEES